MSEDEGWIAGTDATLRHTDDGEKTWSVVEASAPQDAGFNAVHFPSSREGWVSGMKVVLRTLDAGDSWQGKVDHYGVGTACCEPRRAWPRCGSGEPASDLADSS